MSLTQITVLTVNWAGSYGGAEKYQHTMIEGFDQSRYRFIFASPPGEWPQRLRAAGYRQFDVPLRPGLDITSVLLLRRIIEQEKVAIVHALQSRSLLQAGLAARLCGRVGVVQTEYNITMNWYRSGQYPWYVRLINNPARRLVVHVLADHIISLGQSGKDYYTQILHVPDHKVSVIPGPHPLPPERPAPANPQPIIGTAAELTERKGLTYLIDAAPIVLARYPGAQFLIMGRGHLEQRLKQQIAEHHLEQSIHMPGFVPDAAERMAGWDVFVLPSLSDLYPRAILEAMAQGLPVVATQVDGAREMIVHGETGFLVPPGDAEALGQAILRVLDDRSLAHQMGQRARQRIAEVHNVAGVVQQIEAVYRQVLAKYHRETNDAGG